MGDVLLFYIKRTFDCWSSPTSQHHELKATHQNKYYKKTCGLPLETAWVFMKQTQSVQSSTKVLLECIPSSPWTFINWPFRYWTTIFVHVYQCSYRYPSKLVLLDVSQLISKAYTAVMTVKREKNNNLVRLQTFWQNAKARVTLPSSLINSVVHFAASGWTKLDLFLLL